MISTPLPADAVASTAPPCAASITTAFPSSQPAKRITAPSHQAGRCEPSSTSFLLVVHVEVIERLRRTLDARQVVVMRHGDAGHKHRDSTCFGPVKLRVFEVDVMHDLGDGSQRPIVEPQTID